MPQAIGFWDDDPVWIRTIESVMRHFSVPVRATTQGDEIRSWANEGQIGSLVSDLRMPGNVFGVLEEICRTHPEIDVQVLSGFAPDKDEAAQLRKLNIKAYKKTDELIGFLESLTGEKPTGDAEELIEQRQEIELLKKKNRELEEKSRNIDESYAQWTAPVLERLAKIKDPDSKVIIRGDESLTVADLICAIKEKKQIGLHYINLWARAFGRMEGKR